MKWYLRPLSRYMNWITGSGDLDLLKLFYYMITGMMAMALVPVILIESVVRQEAIFLSPVFIILAILGIPNAICMVVLRFDLLKE